MVKAIYLYIYNCLHFYMTYYSYESHICISYTYHLRIFSYEYYPKI